MTADVISNLVIHHCLDYGIHEFVCVEASREAVDELMAQLSDLLSDLPSGKSYPLLIDFSPCGLPPLRYMFMRTRETIRQFPQYGSGRTVVLYRNGALISMAQTFIDLLRHNSQIRLFDAEQRTAALEWLANRD